MHLAEALWIAFGGHSEYPFAVKIATGKICAISGNPWVDHLNKDPQDFVVLPEQPWLDGYCVEKGVIPPVRGHAPGQGLHGRGTVDRSGAARRPSDRSLSDEAQALQAVDGSVFPAGPPAGRPLLRVAGAHGPGPPAGG